MPALAPTADTFAIRGEIIRNPGALTRAMEAFFVETPGDGVYTAAFALPAGATIQDIIVSGPVGWTADFWSATLKVGDAADDDGFFRNINLTDADLVTDECISLGAAGGRGGAYMSVAGAQINRRFSTAARTISAVVTVVGGSTGSDGRTRVTVLYSQPGGADSVRATKV